MSGNAVVTVTRPRAGKIRKIIRQAAKFETLIFGSLIEDTSVCRAPAKGMGAEGCDNAGRCAMGELLFRVGYSNDELRSMDPGGDWNREVYQRLWDAYRIDQKDVNNLIGSNDAVATTDSDEFILRQARVEKEINKMDKKRGRVNPYLTRIAYNGVVIGPEPTKAEQKVLEKFDVYGDFLDKEEEYNEYN